MLHLPIITLHACLHNSKYQCRMHVFKYPTCFKISDWCAHMSKINNSNLMRAREEPWPMLCANGNSKLTDDWKIKSDVLYTILDNGTTLITKRIYVYINRNDLAVNFISKSKNIQYVQDTSSWYSISHHLHQDTSMGYVSLFCFLQYNELHLV